MIASCLFPLAQGHLKFQRKGQVSEVSGHVLIRRSFEISQVLTCMLKLWFSKITDACDPKGVLDMTKTARPCWLMQPEELPVTTYFSVWLAVMLITQKRQQGGHSCIPISWVVMGHKASLSYHQGELYSTKGGQTPCFYLSLKCPPILDTIF